MKEIGKISKIYRFPFKAMGGEELTEVRISPAGQQGDRIYALVNRKKPGNFPWLTSREIPEMVLFRARISGKLGTDLNYPSLQSYQIEVRTPEGETYSADDPSFRTFLQKRWPDFDFEIRFSERGMQDTQPISILSKASLDRLSKEVTLDHLDERRFRANWIVTWHDPEPFYEDKLVGKKIRVGEKLELYITKEDPRCQVINIDPETAKATPDVLQAVGALKKGKVAVYATPLRSEVVKSGDPIYLA